MLNDEVNKRSALVRAQVLEVLDIDGNPDVLLRTELATIVKCSRSVREINALRPGGYYSNPTGNVEYATENASLILQNLQTFQEERDFARSVRFDEYDGLCLVCGEWSAGGCEPDVATNEERGQARASSDYVGACCSDL
jgi:hypothetical protein